MQKLTEGSNIFADAATLLMIIAFIAFAAWLLAHSGQKAYDQGLYESFISAMSV